MIDPQKEKAASFIGMHGENVGLGFVARDTAALEQERRNEISFHLIRNCSNQQQQKWLLDLKNIFARQLPKMPKEYIVKLVFDRHHESMVILKNQSKVVGGICFRHFKPEKFVEIAFLAITFTEQVRGFGTRLMNKLKEELQRRGVEYMMTYADNLALGYFRKQGFSREWRMPAERWRGYIKDYEGGTLVECQIHPAVDYARISDIIRAQKEAVLQAVRAVSINHITFPSPPLPLPFSRINASGETEVFRMDPMQLAGVREAGWTWQEHEELMKTRQMSFLLQCQHVLELVKKHQAAWPFREAVSLADVPDYTAVVKEPIDLKTIENRLTANEYPDKLKFCADIQRLFSNCKLYNQPETMYYKCAVELQDYARPHLQALREESLHSSRSKSRISDKKGKRRE